MSSYKSLMDGKVGALEDRENERTDCFNASKVHWPTHPKADSKGCVAHNAISTSKGFCPQEMIEWKGAYGRTCRMQAWATPEGAEVSLSYSVASGCRGRATNTATVQCENGKYKMLSSSCVKQLPDDPNQHCK